MSATKIPGVRLMIRGELQFGYRHHARLLAELMGGEVPFGPSGLKLYRKDIEFLERVRAQQRERAKRGASA